MNNQQRLLTVFVSAGVLAGCAGGGGSGGWSPGSAAQSQPPRAQSEPSPCGTVNGRPVQCVPTQRAAIDAAMSRSSQGSMPSAESFEALGMYAPPGAKRTSTGSSGPISLDSAGLGFQYQSFGVWNMHLGSGISNSSHGQTTPASAVPTSGSAKFTGELIGLHVSAAGVESTARARVVVDANFNSRTLGFASSNTSLKGAAAPHLDLKGTLTYAPGSSSFAGTLTSAGATVTGPSRGTFYGPQAQELGGVFDLGSKGAEKFSGAYGTRR